MERLTQRSSDTTHENGVCCTHFGGPECTERMGWCTDNCPWEEAAWARLADLEDILFADDGKMVVSLEDLREWLKNKPFPKEGSK